MTSSFVGKTIVVTGATSGIGLATAGELVRQGATVIGVGRSVERCRATEQWLRSLDSSTGSVCCTAELSLQSEVRRLADGVRRIMASRGLTALDGLVNNAGTFTYWFSLTPEGIETQWAVNYLAPFLLTRELMPLLQAAPVARIVTVSSGSHYNTTLNWADLQLRRRYDGLRAYKQTKLAGVMFTAELNRRLGAASPVRALAADPGLVDTEIGRKGTPRLVGWIWDRRRAGGISPQQAAQGIVFLLALEPDQEPGALYWRHGRPLRPSAQALDRAACERLWAISERMCGATSAAETEILERSIPCTAMS